MNKLALIIIVTMGFTTTLAQAQKTNKAISLFLNNKMTEAETALNKIANDSLDPERGKAAIALSLIHKFNQNDQEKVRYFVKGITALGNPDPYAYTLWGDCGFVNYPAAAKQLTDFYAARKVIHPDIRHALHRLRRAQLERSNRYDSLLSLNRSMGYVDHWEMLGCFDYADGYGYYNDEGTLTHPENTYEFTGVHNGRFRWFPVVTNIDMSRLYLNDFLDLGNNGKAYMQTFIQSPTDQEVVLNLVAGTDVRCWINDALVFQNRRNIECIRSLPVHLPIRLKAGNNRLLLQLGKKSEYGNNIDVYCTAADGATPANVRYQTTERQYTSDATKPAVMTDPDIESFNARDFAIYSEQHPDEILEQILRVEELSSNGDKTKTLQALKKLRQQYPGSYYLSNLYYNNKSNVSYSAKDDYLNNNCSDCFATLMHEYNDAKGDDTKEKTKEALAKLEKKYPGNYQLYLTRIEKLMDDNDYPQAEKLINEGLQQYDNKVDLYLLKSTLLTSQGKKDDHAAFLKSILPEMTNTTFSNRLAAYYLEKNDTLAWQRIAREDMKYNFTDDDYFTLSNIYRNSKKYDSAELVMQQLIQKKPFSPTIFERYGDLLADRGNKTEAIRYFRMSLDYYPQDYALIKKIKDLKGEKMEIDQLAPGTMKELYSQKKIKDMVVPAHLSGRSWVMLLRKEASVTYEGAYTRTKSYFFYKILTEAGIKEFKELSNSGEGSELLVFKGNGEVVLPEGYGTWVLPNLQVGDIIGIKEESGYRNGGIRSALYQNTIDLNSNAPVVMVEHDMMISKTLTTKPQLFSKTNAFRLQPAQGNASFDAYTAKAVSPLFYEPELYSVDQYDNQTFVALSNYSSWNEIAQWYWDIAAPVLSQHDSVTLLVKDILKGRQTASAYEKARLLYQWLESNINYSSQSFRQDNYVPQKPNKVLEDKLGDCKDMAALYIVMCREAGIPGNFVLVNTETRSGIFSRFPNNSFNHCIARIYPDGKPLYVELTSKFLPFGSNTQYASYGYGLEVDSSRQCSIAPVHNPEKGDYMSLRSRISTDSGGVRIDQHIDVAGLTSAVLKEAFEKADSTQINTALLKLVTGIIPGSQMRSAGYNAKETGNDTIKMHYTLDNNDLYLDVADLLIYKVPPYLNKLVDESIFANKTRNTDLNLITADGFLSRGDNDVSIIIAEGKSLYKQPSNLQISNEYFDFLVRYHLKPGELSIHKEFRVRKELISAAEYPLFKQEMEKAYKADVTAIVLQ